MAAKNNPEVRAAAKGMKDVMKDGAKQVAKGAQYAVVPGLVAGTVAGRMSSDKKLEKKASSDLAKKIAAKAKDMVGKEGKRFMEGTGGNPVGKGLGAFIGGTAAYKGQKMTLEERRAAKAKK